jgi:glycosyltransferase involved in cell wall biosynthesis
VATRVGRLPEILPEFAGELVDDADPAALVAALRRALQHEWDAARIVEHARQFSWDANIDRLQDLLGGEQR